MSQKQQILKHLKHYKQNGITVREAAVLYDCYCLHKRIADLRADGHNIGGPMVKIGKKWVKRHILLKAAK